MRYSLYSENPSKRFAVVPISFSFASLRLSTINKSSNYKIVYLLARTVATHALVRGWTGSRVAALQMSGGIYPRRSNRSGDEKILSKVSRHRFDPGFINLHMHFSSNVRHERVLPYMDQRYADAIQGSPTSRSCILVGIHRNILYISRDTIWKRTDSV